MHTHTDTHSHTKESWRAAEEEEVNFDPPAGHSKAEVMAEMQLCKPQRLHARVCRIVCLCEWVRVETTGVWPLLSYPQGWIWCMRVRACACVDHLVGTVANFSIRHTHTIFSIRPKGQALFIHHCVQSQRVAVPLQADAGRPQ